VESQQLLKFDLETFEIGIVERTSNQQPAKRLNHASIFYNDKIYVFGGESLSG